MESTCLGCGNMFDENEITVEQAEYYGKTICRVLGVTSTYICCGIALEEAI